MTSVAEDTGLLPPTQQYPRSPSPPSLSDIPRTLPDPTRLPPVSYTVQVSTANTRWAGTDKDVYMVLVGDLHTTDYIHLKENPANNMQSSLRYAPPDNLNSATSPTDFPQGSIREFRFNATPVGNLIKITIRHDPTKEQSAAWKLDRVVVRNEELHRTWTFLCSRWLSRDMGNVVDLKPLSEISAGRRASRRASRRLSTGKHIRVSTVVESSVGADHFASMRDVFGGDAAPTSDDPLSNGSETGTRRVCFQLQKFTNKYCHVYLLGEIPALGGWRSDQALRMTMQSAADGTWRGEWRLELEIDDDYDDIQYTYMIINESDSKKNCPVSTPDRLRRFKLSAPDSLGRTTEGGRIHIRDSFGANKFGLPSASRPSLVLRKPLSREELITTPRGEATLISGTLGPDRGLPAPPSEGVPRNLNTELDSASEERSSNSDVVDERKMLDSDEYDENVLASQSSVGNHVVEESTALKELSQHREVVDITVSPKEKIQREEEAARREWKEQLEESDGQLFKSARSLLRRQSEVLYLKKRNSREVSDAHLLLSAGKSPEKTSPVSSDGMADDESFIHDDDNRDIIDLSHSAIKKPLIEERDRLREEVARLEEERKRKEVLYVSAKSTYETVKEELQELRGEMSARCEEYGAQHAELVKLVMDGQEAYRAASELLVAERDQLYGRWRKEFKARRKLFNTIQELRGNIRVFCRVRPLKQPALADGSNANVAVDFPDASADENSRIQLGSKCFEFDHVFPPSTGQTAVYEETAGVVASVLDGYNVCVFAYGQTGSGKTHTMDGPEEDRGVNYRALVDLFDIAEQRSEFQDVSISVSILEIYNENLRDLIREDDGSAAPKLDIRKDPKSASATAVYVPNLTEIAVDSVESVWEVMNRGANNRSKGKTNMNEHSSRSHLILKVTVTCEDFSSGVKSSGLLHLVDLAGSERVGRSNVSGDRLKEAQHINKSLAALGDVFMSLLSHNGHIPYRNSRLTYLLQDSLGGDSKTLMFVNVSADKSDASETVSSLQFAQRVAKVELGSARKHTEKTTETKAVAALQTKETELQELNSKFAGVQRELRKRDDATAEAKERVRAIEMELKSAKAKLEEHSRREDAEREGLTRSAQELRELRALHERGQAELRAAKQKARDVAVGKDEEISRLTALLKAKDRKIAEMVRQQTSRQVERSALTPSTRMPRPVSTPVVGRRADRTPLTRLPRNAATFTGRSRQVRFEDTPSGPEVPAQIASDDAAAMPPPPTPMSSARRTVERNADGKVLRSQSMVPRVAHRQPSRTGATPAKQVSYAFGSRVETNAPDASGNKPARNVRLPRTQTTLLRPAQRVSQTPNERAGQPSLVSSGRAVSAGARRAGSMANLHRPGSGASGPSK